MNEVIQTLQDQGVFNIRNGSAEVFFDDVGQVQKIMYRIKKVRRDLPLEVREIKRGTAIAHFDGAGVMQKVIYETEWKREKTGLDNM